MGLQDANNSDAQDNTQVVLFDDAGAVLKGQRTSAQSVPTVLASDQPAIPVTASAGTNLNTSLLSLESTQSAQSVLYGPVAETAPATDTASSGLNGRLQRIAQRITTFLASITTTGSSSPTSAIQIGASDGAAPSLLAVQGRVTAPALNSFGVVTRSIPFEPESFCASATAFVPPAAATDIFTITGSATKTIRIHKIRVSGTTTSGSAIKTTFTLLRRSTVDTAGTRVAATVGKQDTNNAAGTATAGHYTANPTLGTLVANLRSSTASVSATGLAGGDLVWDFEADGSQPLTLRGVSDQIAVNLNGGTVTGPLFSVSAEWSEV
jgi:hypothetical protein